MASEPIPQPFFAFTSLYQFSGGFCIRCHTLGNIPKVSATLFLYCFPLNSSARVDLLLGKSELDALHSSIHTSNRPLFSDEPTWDLDPSIYLPQFLSPLPQGNYRTMIISTAGHWTTTLFSGFHNENEDGNGLRELLSFFGEAMELWITEITEALDKAERLEKQQRHMRGRSKERQVIVRAYVHGHDSCHSNDVELAGPLKEYTGLARNWYNWGWIRRFNDVFEVFIYPLFWVSLSDKISPDGYIAEGTSQCPFPPH